MIKRIFAVAAAASVSLLGVTAAATAQAASHARPAGHLPGVRVINLHRAYEAQLGHVKPGQISGIVYPLGHRPEAAAKSAAATCTEPACSMTWHSGTVQHNPHVYLVLWGPTWSTDPNQEASAAYLENFYAGLGVKSQDNWSTITSQYADSTGAPAFNGSVSVFTFNDTSSPSTGATDTQIAAEADAFATTHHIADLNNAQIVVATQSGTCPVGFAAPCNGTSGTYCAYHSATSSGTPYINLPYIPDAGTMCGKDFVNPTPTGDNDGWSIVGGREYADTITDPFPPNGWIDSNDTSGGEIGDKCAGILPGNPGGAFNLTLSTGAFAVGTLWSNAALSSGANGCVATGAIQDSVSFTSPGTQQNATGDTVNLAINGSSAAGNPLTWKAGQLPTGLVINSSTGTVTGTPTIAGQFTPTVIAMDQTGAQHSVSFNWTIKAAGSGAVTGDHSKCLDDFGSGTANGTKVDIWTCNGTLAQTWTFSGDALSVLGKCLDDASQGGSGAVLVIWMCNGHRAQTWTHKSNGEYVLQLNGLCLTDPNASSVNGTQVLMRPCHNLADQHWSLP
jgi:serine protease